MAPRPALCRIDARQRRLLLGMALFSFTGHIWPSLRYRGTSPIEIGRMGLTFVRWRILLDNHGQSGGRENLGYIQGAG